MTNKPLIDLVQITIFRWLSWVYSSCIRDYITSALHSHRSREFFESFPQLQISRVSVCTAYGWLNPQSQSQPNVWKNNETGHLPQPTTGIKTSHFTFTALFLSSNYPLKPPKPPKNNPQRSYLLQMQFIRSSTCGNQWVGICLDDGFSLDLALLCSSSKGL